MNMIGFLLSIVVNIVSFGAISNNEVVNNAEAINHAIDHCARQGGGRVVIPCGEFYTGSIFLKSGVKLFLEEGAVLKGVQAIDAYSSLETTLDLSRYESGQGTVNFNSATDPQWSKALIFAVGVSDACIEGKGCIDGADVRNPLGEEHLRGPHTILMAGCKRMRFDGFKVKCSANYAFLGFQIEKSKFTNLNIEGGWDGIHIRGAKNVEITHCEMHTGDDAIAGGYWNNMHICHNILNSSCNGIRMIMPSIHLSITDNEIYGPGKFEHITSHRTRSEAAINLEPGGWGNAPGHMDEIYIQRNKVSHVLTPLCVTLSDNNSMGRLLVEDLEARSITRMALSVKSWGTAPTDCVVMRRCDMEFEGIDDPTLPAWFENRPTNQWPVFPVWGMYFRNVKKVDVKDVKLSVKGKEYRKAWGVDNVQRHNLSTVEVSANAKNKN